VCIERAYQHFSRLLAGRDLNGLIHIDLCQANECSLSRLAHFHFQLLSALHFFAERRILRHASFYFTHLAALCSDLIFQNLFFSALFLLCCRFLRVSLNVEAHSERRGSDAWYGN